MNERQTRRLSDIIKTITALFIIEKLVRLRQMIHEVVLWRTPSLGRSVEEDSNAVLFWNFPNSKFSKCVFRTSCFLVWSKHSWSIFFCHWNTLNVLTGSTSSSPGSSSRTVSEWSGSRTPAGEGIQQAVDGLKPAVHRRIHVTHNSTIIFVGILHWIQTILTLVIKSFLWKSWGFEQQTLLINSRRNVFCITRSKRGLTFNWAV